MKVGNQEGSGFPPMTRAQWIIVILGIIAFVVIVLGGFFWLASIYP
jgi:hypothetical protein